MGEVVVAAILAVCGGLCQPADAEAVLQAATVASRTHRVPVTLMLAVGEVESQFYPRAVNPKTHAWGVWQLHPKMSWSRRAVRGCAIDPPGCLRYQAAEAARLLRLGRDRCGSWGGSLTSYSHRGGPCHTSGYGEKVLQAWTRWRNLV